MSIKKYYSYKLSYYRFLWKYYHSPLFYRYLYKLECFLGVSKHPKEHVLLYMIGFVDSFDDYSMLDFKYKKDNIEYTMNEYGNSLGISDYYKIYLKDKDDNCVLVLEIKTENMPKYLYSVFGTELRKAKIKKILK